MQPQKVRKREAMHIELTDPNTVRITWPVAFDPATEAEIAKRLASVPGMQGMGRRYWCSAMQTPRLMDLFPRASFDYAALQAADALSRRFCDAMAQMGVQLQISGSGAVVGVGDGVSPVLQEAIAARSHAHKRWVARGWGQPKPRRDAPQPMHGPYTADDARFEPLVNGMQNAAKKAAEDAVKYSGKRRRFKKTKKELAR
jgi:hypothetical protein